MFRRLQNIGNIWNELTQKEPKNMKTIWRMRLEAYRFGDSRIPKSMIQNYVNQMKRNIEDQGKTNKDSARSILAIQRFDDWQYSFAKFAENASSKIW